MTLPTRTIEPSKIFQGEELEWTRDFDDFTADLYTLEYRFRGPSTGFNVTATADGTGFHAEIESASSLTMTPGRWMWQAWATEIADSDHVQMIASGFVQAISGYATATTTAIAKSTAQQIVDAIDAAILASSADSDVVEYEIDTPSGKKRVRRSRSEAASLRSIYAKIVSQETARDRVATGGSFGRQIKVRTWSQ